MPELKWRPGQTAELNVLTDSSRKAAMVRIMEITGRRIRLEVAPELKQESPVRLDWDGQMVLGEVLHSAPDGVWIEIHHMLLES